MTAQAIPRLPGGQEGESRWFLLEDVSWDLYEQLRLQTDQSGQHIKMIFDGGRLILMSPLLPKHERVKTVVARLIEVLTMELQIPIEALGSTTWRRQDLAKGIEADECYFIQHESQARDKETWDLASDPPPDLVVEVDITHHPLDRQAIYAGLGVAELWQYDGAQIQFFRLSKSGRYEPAESSLSLPIDAADVNRFIAMIGTMDQTNLLLSFRQWIRTRRGSSSQS
jgi:Uma2 family endonuclease